VKQHQTYREISVALFSGNGEHRDSGCCKKMQQPLLVQAVFRRVQEHFHIHLMHKPPVFFISTNNKPVATLLIFFFLFLPGCHGNFEATGPIVTVTKHEFCNATPPLP
jgi:hypothetical protein